MSSEMHRHFHDELNDVKVRLLTMSGEAEAALGLAVDALLERSASKAHSVITSDRAIDNMEMEIEEACVNLLALQQPMARDLRMLTSALKIANDLERVGDHAVNIAQSAERLSQSRPIAPEPEIVEMARLARDMLSDSLEAFIRGDAAAAREVCLRDDKVDNLHRSVFRILLTHMMEDPHMIGAGMELFLVSRNLEVADPRPTWPRMSSWSKASRLSITPRTVARAVPPELPRHRTSHDFCTGTRTPRTAGRRGRRIQFDPAPGGGVRRFFRAFGDCGSKGTAAPGDGRGPHPTAGPRGGRARHRRAQAHA
jgi:phosphate transport system protein